MKLARRILTITALTLFSFLICNSQAQTKNNKKLKPDLSGTWVFVNDKDVPKEIFIRPIYNSPVKRSNPCLKEIRMKIEHNEPELKFFYTYVFANEEKTAQEIYYTDERKEQNVDFFYECEGEKIIFHDFKNKSETETYWKGSTLITRGGALERFQTQTETISEYKLSKDGQTLTINVRILIDPRKNNPRLRSSMWDFDDIISYKRTFHRVQETK